MNNLELKQAYNYKKEVKELFTEYTNMLIENDPKFKEYLDIQNYDEEINNLEHKYGLPEGRLYLLYFNNKLAGCIGLKKIDNDNCEMKRLYIKEEYRNNHLGEYLVDKIIKDAKEIGYKYMLLDTLPFLKSAINLYKKYGFYEIKSYNNSPMDTSIYMKLDLRGEK